MSSNEGKYWHQLSQEEIDGLVSSGKTWGEIMAEYKQPDWCSYPEALRGEMGCWSLIDFRVDGLRTKISNEFCKDCECYKE